MEVAVLEEDLEGLAFLYEIVGSWPFLHSIPNPLLQLLLIVSGDDLGIGHVFGHELGHRNLIDPQVGVRRNDRSTGEIHTLSRQITTESSLLSLESLHETPNGFSQVRFVQARDITVDVNCDLELHVVPALHDRLHRCAF